MKYRVTTAALVAACFAVATPVQANERTDSPLDQAAHLLNGPASNWFNPYVTNDTRDAAITIVFAETKLRIPADQIAQWFSYVIGCIDALSSNERIVEDKAATIRRLVVSCSASAAARAATKR
jgi:hypothetical protein